MVRPIEKSTFYLSLKEVAVQAGLELLMVVDDKIAPIVSASQGILDQQLRPRPIHLLNIIFNLKYLYNIDFRSVIDINFYETFSNLTS
jgi:hypothetical protein